MRIRLVNEAGRFDLVVDAENDDYTDAGGNQAINDGIKYLNEIRADLMIVLPNESFKLLVLDTDTNYWCDKKPHLLVNAARYILEVRHRNSEGVDDFDDVIFREIHQIHANDLSKSIANDIAADAEQRVMQG